MRCFNMVWTGVVTWYILTIQDEIAFKQKQREDKKKLADAQAKASQKGPMGECVCVCAQSVSVLLCLIAGVGGIKKSKKWSWHSFHL